MKMGNEDFDEDFDDEFDDIQDNTFGGSSQPFEGQVKDKATKSSNFLALFFGATLIVGVYFAYGFFKNNRQKQVAKREQARELVASKQQDLQIKNLEADFLLSEDTNLGDEVAPSAPFRPKRKTLSETDLEIKDDLLIEEEIEEVAVNTEQDEDLASHEQSNLIDKEDEQEQKVTKSAMQPELDTVLQQEAKKLNSLNNIENINIVKDDFSQDEVSADLHKDLYIVKNQVEAASSSEKVARVHAISDEFKKTVESLGEEVTLNVNQIKELEIAVDTITNTLNRVSQTVNKLDSRMAGIDDSLNNLSNEIINVKKVMHDEDLDLTSRKTANFSERNAKEQPVVYSSPEYVVHAIIPGRAWLKSSGGQIITVTEGDSVGDFGRIAVIDSLHNVVRTSSGITFR